MPFDYTGRILRAVFLQRKAIVHELADFSRRCIALVLVYSTVGLTMPVHADEVLRGATHAAGTPQLRTPSAGDHAPTQRPKLLRPGDALESETDEIIVPTSRSKVAKSQILSPGMHYARVVVEAQIQGTHSFIQAVSSPLEPTIEAEPSVEKCQ